MTTCRIELSFGRYWDRQAVATESHPVSRSGNGPIQAVKETCAECHDTERKYYIDTEIESMIDSIGTVLQNPSVDAGKVQALGQGIGQESCFKCHLVHLPAAMARANMMMASNRK